MPSRPLSLSAELVSLGSGDRVRADARKTTAIPKFFTVEQVAELLEVSTRTVRRWIERGELVAHSFGRAVRIAESDLKTFVASHRDS